VALQFKFLPTTEDLLLYWQIRLLKISSMRENKIHKKEEGLNSRLKVPVLVS
jgi:hypothetical protein